MSALQPSSLPENAGLAFIGEQSWPAARVTAREAKSFASAQNPSGRPNTDVLRDFIGFSAGKITGQTQIDFPPYFTAQEASLYREPFDKLRANLCPPTHAATWWISPHANPELRTALARLERFLVMPVDAKIPAWKWIDSHLLPDASFLAVARDDDFTAGVLQSRLVHCWWRQYSSQLSPTEIVTSLPFPWPPTTLLSALNRTQEEQRHAVARAARSENQEQIDSMVTAAYGWSNDLTDEEILVQLQKLNHERTRR